jgi:hypothetical protein
MNLVEPSGIGPGATSVSPTIGELSLGISLNSGYAEAIESARGTWRHWLHRFSPESGRRLHPKGVT